jgi:hypothetical protein
MKKLPKYPIPKGGCHPSNLYYVGRGGFDNQPIQLKKLVVTEIKNNYFRAHLMTRQNEGETWQTSWKVEGGARKVKQTLINIDFL